MSNFAKLGKQAKRVQASKLNRKALAQDGAAQATAAEAAAAAPTTPKGADSDAAASQAAPAAKAAAQADAAPPTAHQSADSDTEAAQSLKELQELQEFLKNIGLQKLYPMLIDEVLTPDSSRYWSLESWVADKKQDNFDKQLLRNFAEKLHESGLWDKTPPGPMIPEELVQTTRLRYQDLHNNPK